MNDRKKGEKEKKSMREKSSLDHPEAISLAAESSV